MQALRPPRSGSRRRRSAGRQAALPASAAVAPAWAYDPSRNAEALALAASIRDNNSFVGPGPLSEGPEATAHASPGYPWLLGLLKKAIPDDKFELLVRWGHCVLGALTAGFYFLFARRAFRSTTAGLLTGLLCAIYPFWVVNTAAIDDGVLATFLVSLGVLHRSKEPARPAGRFPGRAYGPSAGGDGPGAGRPAALRLRRPGLVPAAKPQAAERMAGRPPCLPRLRHRRGAVDRAQLAGVQRADADRRFGIPAPMDGQ